MRQWTVCLIVVDGFWQTARLVVGPFVSPEPVTDPELFIADMYVRMKAAFTGLLSEAWER